MLKNICSSAGLSSYDLMLPLICVKTYIMKRKVLHLSKSKSVILNTMYLD